LKSVNNIDVSYFAAGIIAHLASDGPAAWAVKEPSRSIMLSELVGIFLLFIRKQYTGLSFCDVMPHGDLGIQGA